MEQGNTRSEEFSANPQVSMYQDIQDGKREFKILQEIRQTWVIWAKRYLEEHEQVLMQPERGKHQHRSKI